MASQAPHGASPLTPVSSLSAARSSAGGDVVTVGATPDFDGVGTLDGSIDGVDAPVPASRKHFSPVPTAERHTPDGRRPEDGSAVWRVQCGDLIGRERCVTVYVDNDDVVLVGPPGETARLTGTQLGQLRAALGEAAKLAER
ncbi:hypothetical protein HQ32_03928 [Prauserella sp. Am3]|nr:hypothetical protein HQ32_03928 [Prauserella sp. Am3]